MGRTDAEAETSIIRPPDVKSQLVAKDPDAGKDWRQEKGMTEDEMVRWHHQPNGHEFEQAPGVGDEQVGLACCSPWGWEELNMTELLNNNNNLLYCKTKYVYITLLSDSFCRKFLPKGINVVFISRRNGGVWHLTHITKLTNIDSTYE